MGVSLAKLIIYNIVLLFICHNKRSSSSSSSISCLDDSLFRDGAIFYVTFLRNEFRKSPDTHGKDN